MLSPRCFRASRNCACGNVQRQTASFGEKQRIFMVLEVLAPGSGLAALLPVLRLITKDDFRRRRWPLRSQPWVCCECLAAKVKKSLRVDHHDFTATNPCHTDEPRFAHLSFER